MNQSYVPSPTQLQQLHHQALGYAIPEEDMDASEDATVSCSPHNLNTDNREPRKRKFRERRSLDSMSSMSRRVVSSSLSSPVPGIMSGIPRETLTATKSYNYGGITAGRPMARRSLDAGSITAGLPRTTTFHKDNLDICEFVSSSINNNNNNNNNRSSSSNLSPRIGLVLSSDSNASSSNSLTSIGSNSAGGNSNNNSKVCPGITSGLPVCSPTDVALPDTVFGLPVCNSTVAGITSGIPMSNIKGANLHGIVSGIPPPSNINTNRGGGNTSTTPSSLFPICDMMSQVSRVMPGTPGITSGIPVRRASHDSFSGQQGATTPRFNAAMYPIAPERELLEPWDQTTNRMAHQSAADNSSLSYSLSAMDISEIDDTSQCSQKQYYNDDDNNSIEDLASSFESGGCKFSAQYGSKQRDSVFLH